jgi:hypothetical protein
MDKNNKKQPADMNNTNNKNTTNNNRTEFADEIKAKDTQAKANNKQNNK